MNFLFNNTSFTTCSVKYQHHRAEECRAVETLCTLTLSESEVLQAMQAINIYQGSCITAVLQAASPPPAPAVRICSWRIVLWFLTL